jgi:hypothetical protein
MDQIKLILLFINAPPDDGYIYVNRPKPSISLIATPETAIMAITAASVSANKGTSFGLYIVVAPFAYVITITLKSPYA